MVRDAPAVSLSQVAAEQAADYSESGTDDHEEDTCCDLACEVGKEEDDNTCVHKDCQHNSRDAPRHVLPPSCSEAFCIADCAVSCLTRAVRHGTDCKSLTVPQILLPTAYLQPLFSHDFIGNCNVATGVGFAAGVSELEILAMTTSVEDRPQLAGHDSHGQNCTQNSTYILYDRHGPVLGFETEDELPANQKSGEGSN